MTILNTGQMGTLYWLLCTSMSVFIGIILLLITSSIKNKIFVWVLCTICPIGIFCFTYFVGEPLNRYTYYDVILNEDFSAVEFLENYEVISINGNIFRIKDR